MSYQVPVDRMCFAPCGAPSAAPDNKDKTASCYAHFGVHCAASLSPAARMKLLAGLRNTVRTYDPNDEHQAWIGPMIDVPPSVMARDLAPWIRDNLFNPGGAEKVALMPTTSLESQDTYYYEWDPVTERWYLVCVHSLGLSEYDNGTSMTGNEVRIDFDPQLPKALLTIVLAYRPGKAHQV